MKISDKTKLIADLRWAMTFIQESGLRYEEQKDNRKRIISYLSKTK